MRHSIVVYADNDIASALERYTAEEQCDFAVQYRATSYYDCFEPAVRDHIEILILQIKSPVAHAQDLMYDLQCANYTPVILLFDIQEDGRLRYTLSDHSAGRLADAVAMFFTSALAGTVHCTYASFRTTVWEDNMQRFADKAARNECLKEILRGCSEEEFLVHRERYRLDLKEHGYYLYFWEILDKEYRYHHLYKDIYNFFGETLQRECLDTINSYNGGEVFYNSLLLLCIVINDKTINSEAKRNTQFEEMLKKLTVFTGCKTASRYLSGRLDSFKGLRDAYDKYHIQKSLAFFVRDVAVMQPSLLKSRNKTADMEAVNQLLRDITNYLRYDILNEKLKADIHTLYYDYLKPSMSYTLFYSCTASICSAVSEVQDLDDTAPTEIVSPGLLPYSSIEEQYEMILGQIQKLQSQSAHKRQTKNALVLKAVDFIAENYNQNITITDIAGALFVNNNHLSHMFKRETGISVIKYLITHRIEQAKRLLIETDDLIYIISEEVGFNEFRHFSKTFKKFTGLSPAQYRKQNRYRAPQL